MENKEGGKIIAVESDKFGFIFGEETIVAFDVKKGKFVI